MDWQNLPFDEAIEFFRNKLRLPSATWRDIEKEAHDTAFVVAGATKDSLLKELQAAILKQFESGISFRQFQKDFDDIVARTGWAYKGDREWRTRVIYDTNFRTAYAAGRVQQAKDPEFARALPYWKYRHSGAEHYRPLHKAWDDLVLPATDKFWLTNTPPNGFGCRCTFQPISERMLKKMGKAVPDRNPYDVMRERGIDPTREVIDKTSGEVVRVPLGVDLGFDYQPGASLTKARPFSKGGFT